MKKTFSVIILGFTSMVAQIVFLRKLMVIFCGNELSLAVALASWLLWTAIGSWIAAKGKFFRRYEDDFVFAYLQLAIAVFLPFIFLFSGYLPKLLGVFPGEVVGPFSMLVSGIVLLGPVSILSGALFVVGCSMFNDGREESVQIGYVYIIEALGATVGGFLTGIFLIRLLSPLHILLLLSFLNLLSAFILLPKRGTINKIFVFLLFLAAICLYFKSDEITEFSIKKEWGRSKVLVSEDSVYANTTIVQRDELYTLFTNGLYSFTVPDQMSSQWLGHLPLLEHPAPKKVLLIGGGIGGMLDEMLKHPLECIDYVEIDPLLIKLAFKYMPLADWQLDPRVNLIKEIDGRYYVKKTNISYDLVVVSVPAPSTAQINRLYTKEFFEDISRILNNDGIFAFAMRSNPNYISEDQARLYKTLLNTLKLVFPETRITPGENNYFFASKNKGVLTLDGDELRARLDSCGVKADYLREYFLYTELTKERVEAFEERLDSVAETNINRDLVPIAYYYDMILWSTYFDGGLKNILKLIGPSSLWNMVVISLIFVLLLGLIFRSSYSGILVSVGITGFNEMAFQVITMISFQIIYGYLYYKLAVILSFYMLGIIAGGLVSSDLIKRGRVNYKLLVTVQGWITIYPLLLLFIINIFLGLKVNKLYFMGTSLLFSSLPCIAGFLGGFQFPLANRLYLEKARGMTLRGSAGITYAVDVVGAFLGAFFVALFFIPLLGIPLTCIICTLLSIIGMTLLIASERKKSV